MKHLWLVASTFDSCYGFEGAQLSRWYNNSISASVYAKTEAYQRFGRLYYGLPLKALASFLKGWNHSIVSKHLYEASEAAFDPLLSPCTPSNDGLAGLMMAD